MGLLALWFGAGIATLPTVGTQAASTDFLTLDCRLGEEPVLHVWIALSRSWAIVSPPAKEYDATVTSSEVTWADKPDPTQLDIAYRFDRTAETLDLTYSGAFVGDGHFVYRCSQGSTPMPSRVFF